MSDIIGFSITSAALVMSVMGLLFTAAMPEFDHWSKRFFQSYFINTGFLLSLTGYMRLLYHQAILIFIQRLLVVSHFLCFL